MNQRYKISWEIWIGMLVLCLFFGSCKTTKTAMNDSILSITTVIEELVIAENTGDFKKLQLMYADDYKSLSPVYNGTKASLLAIMEKSYKSTPTEVKAKILDSNTGSKVATANLFWSIYDEDGTLLYARPLLQIWVFRDGRWQLQRSLFYEVEEVLEFEE